MEYIQDNGYLKKEKEENVIWEGYVCLKLFL